MKCRYNAKNKLISIELSLDQVKDIENIFNLVCNEEAYVYLDDYSGIYKFDSIVDSNSIEKLLIKGKKDLGNMQSLMLFSDKIENPRVDKEFELLKEHAITFLFEFDYGENICHILIKNIGDELERIKQF